MNDQTELLESALNGLQEGIALFRLTPELVFWNEAAEAITGYPWMELTEQPMPRGLIPLTLGDRASLKSGPDVDREPREGALVKIRHKLGHEIQVITRVLVLRDQHGEPIGTAAVFHSTKNQDVLPRGSGENGETVGAGQSEIEERLWAEFEDFEKGGPPFGVLRMTVDQAEDLRKTHGCGACGAMLDKVERAVRSGLRGTETIGRWSEEEFLVISHEPTAERLLAHARILAGLARTVEFKWWGDRISITVSTGIAQISRRGHQGIADLLDHAREAMESSLRAGGNRVMQAAEGPLCLPS